MAFRFGRKARIIEGLRRDIEGRDELIAVLQRDSRTDRMTGIGNRKAFDEHLEEEINRHLRESETNRRTKREVASAVVFIDLDGFKSINDTLGHAAGDEVLKAVGMVLATRIRSSDKAYRLGGDEFALILEGVDYDGAIATVNKIKAALMADPSIMKITGEGMGMSAGIASMTEQAFTVESGREDMAGHHTTAVRPKELADARMYKEKKGKPAR